MAYLALKKCSFAGKTYLIGEVIPDGIVHDKAVPRLKRMGMIADAVEGVLPPETPVPTSASIESNDSMDDNSGDSGSDQSGEGDEALTMEELMKYKKAELLETAEKLGLDAASMGDLTKEQISAEILKVAGEA